MAEYIGCPVCRRPGDMSVTKSSTNSTQYAVTCPTHGRIQTYWSTTLASAAGKAACLPTAKVKRSVPKA